MDPAGRDKPYKPPEGQEHLYFPLSNGEHFRFTLSQNNMIQKIKKQAPRLVEGLNYKNIAFNVRHKTHGEENEKDISVSLPLKQFNTSPNPIQAIVDCAIKENYPAGGVEVFKKLEEDPKITQISEPTFKELEEPLPKGAKSLEERVCVAEERPGTPPRAPSDTEEIPGPAASSSAASSDVEDSKYASTQSSCSLSDERSCFERLKDADLSSLKLDDQLFAHIHLNALAKESKYEGSKAFKSMRFLKAVDQLLQELQLPSLKEDFARIADDYLEIDAKLEEASISETIEKTLFPKIEKLEPGQKLLIPSGFVGSPGHAMLAEVERTKENYSFRIYNSGLGLDWHARYGEKFCLVKGYDGLKIEDLVKSNLFFDLLNLKVENSKSLQDLSAEHVYFCVETCLMGKDHVQRTLIREDTRFQAPQKAGTCAWHCFKAWLGKKDHTRLIKYLSLKSFFEKNKAALKDSAEKRELLRKAMERFLSQEELRVEESQANPDIRDLELAIELCQDIQKALEEARQQEFLETSKAFETGGAEKSYPKELIQFDKAHPFSVPRHQMQKKGLDQRLVPHKMPEAAKSLSALPEWLLKQKKACLEFVRQKDIAIDHKMQFFKSMLDALPLPSKAYNTFWQDPSFHHWQAISKELLQILAMFKQLQQRRTGTVEITDKIYNDQILATIDLAVRKCPSKKDPSKTVGDLLIDYPIKESFLHDYLTKKAALRQEQGHKQVLIDGLESPELQKKWQSLSDYFPQSAQEALFEEKSLTYLYEHYLSEEQKKAIEEALDKDTKLKFSEEFTKQNAISAFLFANGIKEDPLNDLREAYLMANADFQKTKGASSPASLNSVELSPDEDLKTNYKAIKESAQSSFLSNFGKFVFSKKGNQILYSAKSAIKLRQNMESQLAPLQARKAFECIDTKSFKIFCNQHPMDLAAIINAIDADDALLNNLDWQYFLMDCVTKSLISLDPSKDKPLFDALKNFLERQIEKRFSQDTILLQPLLFLLELQTSFFTKHKNQEALLKNAKLLDALIKKAKNEQNGLKPNMLHGIFACRLFLHLKHADLFFENRQKEIFQDLFHTQGGETIALAKNEIHHRNHNRENICKKIEAAFQANLREELFEQIYQKKDPLRAAFQIDAFNAFLHEEGLLGTEKALETLPNEDFFVKEGSFFGNVLQGIYQIDELSSAQIPDSLRNATCLKEIGLQLPTHLIESKDGFELEHEGQKFHLNNNPAGAPLITRFWERSKYLYMPEKEDFPCWLFQYEVWQSTRGYIFCDPKNHKVLYKASKAGSIERLDENGEVLETLINTEEHFHAPWKEVFSNWRPALLWQNSAGEQTLSLPLHGDENGQTLCFSVKLIDGQKRLFFKSDPNFELKAAPPPNWTAPSSVGPLFLYHREKDIKRLLLPAFPLFLEKDKASKGAGMLPAYALKADERYFTKAKQFTIDTDGRVQAQTPNDWLHLAHYCLMTKDQAGLAHAMLSLNQFDSFEEEQEIREKSVQILEQWMQRSGDPNDQIIALLSYYTIFIRCRKDDTDELAALKKQVKELPKLLENLPQLERSGLKKYDQERILELLAKKGLKILAQELCQFLYQKDLPHRLAEGEIPDIAMKQTQLIKSINKNMLKEALKEIKNYQRRRKLDPNEQELEIFNEAAYTAEMGSESLMRICQKIQSNEALGQQAQITLRAKRRILAQMYRKVNFYDEISPIEEEHVKNFTKVLCLLTQDLAFFSQDPEEITDQEFARIKADFIKKIPRFLEREELQAWPILQEKQSPTVDQSQLALEDSKALEEERQALIQKIGSPLQENAQENMQKELQALEQAILSRLNKNPFLKGSAEFAKWEAKKVSGKIRERELADAYAAFINPMGLQDLQKPPLYLREEEALLIETEVARALELKHQIKVKGPRCYSLKHDDRLSQEQKAMLFFEAEAEICLRERQVELIQSLLKKDGESFMPQVQELMMGEGKSKILLPILAQALADGNTLPCLIVPEALYESNLRDLQKLSLKMFKQAFRSFEFSRDTLKKPSGLEKLQRFVENLELAITERSSFVLKPATLHALYLSYHEELANFPYFKDTKALKRYLDEHPEFKLLQKALNLLKTKAHFLIDEIDTVLRCTDETHYTLDEPRALNFSLFQKACLFNHAAIGLANRLKIKTEDDYKKYKDEFIKLALKHLSGVTLNQGQQKPFLEGAGIDIIKGVRSDETKELLAFFKASIEDYLPRCLSRQHNVKYGLSLQESEQARLYAIPYLSNNQPNEAADFSQAFETVLYTELCYTKEPPPQKHLKRWLHRLKKEALDETEQKNLLLEDTEIAKRFFQTTDLLLSSLHEENETAAKALQKAFLKGKNKETLLYFYLEHAVFPQMKSYPKKLSSYGVSLVELAKSTQGFTGTLWNGKSYHETLSQNLHPQEAPIRTLKETLKRPEKTLKVSCIATKDPQKFMEEALTSGLQTKRAVIDIGAQFAGIDNEQVVRGFAAYFREKKFPIGGILYYDKENRLNVYNVKTGATRPLIGTDIGQIKDQYKEEALFTYYDQAHTTGSDIRQMDNATAIVCVGHETLDRDLCQGVMRMRQLTKGNQNLEFVLSETLAKKIDLEGSMKEQMEKIFAYCENLEKERTQRENFHALQQKIRNCCQRIVEEELQKSFQKAPQDSLHCYHALNNPAVRQFFVQDCDDSLAIKYARALEEKKSEELIKECIEEWKKKCLAALNNLGIEEERRKTIANSIDVQMQRLYEDMKAHIPDTIQGFANISETAQRQELKQEEKQEERQKELQQELQQIMELKANYHRIGRLENDLRENKWEFWRNCLEGACQVEELDFLFNKDSAPAKDLETSPLSFFSENLYLSQACGWRKENKKQLEPIFFNAYAREIPYFAWIQEDGKAAKLVLLDHQDGTELWDAMQNANVHKTKISLCSFDGTVLKGPPAPEDEQGLVLQALIVKADIKKLWAKRQDFIQKLAQMEDDQAFTLLQNLLKRAALFYEAPFLQSFFKNICQMLQKKASTMPKSTNLALLLTTRA